MSRAAVSLALALAAVATAQPETGREFESYQYTSAFEMPGRLDQVKADCISKAALQQAVETLTADLTDVTTGIQGRINASITKLESEQEAIELEVNTTVDNAISKFDTKFSALEASLTQESAALEGIVTARIANLTAEVDNALKTYEQAKTWPNGSHPMYNKNYQLVSVAKSPFNTANGHGNKIFYKIKYNLNNPSFWWNDRRELFEGCRTLSEDMMAVDGIDRDLAPVCDHDHNNPDHYCRQTRDEDGASVHFSGSYFSNCGCSGHPRSSHCVGMSRQFLSGSVFYNRDGSWSGCRLLRHNGPDCSHDWIGCHGNYDRQSEFTVCSSRNGVQE